MTASWRLVLALAMAFAVTVPRPVAAADCGVQGKARLFDRLAARGKARINYRGGAGVSCLQKGSEGDPSQLSGTYEIFYADDPSSNRGAFVMPSPWLVNKAGKAKYLNRTAPFGSGAVKVAGVRDGRLVRLGARGLGDTQQLDLLSGPPGPGGVISIFTIENAADGQTYRICTRWAESLGSRIRYDVLDAGLGAKLFLEQGVPSPCQLGPTTTSTSVTTTTSSSTTSTSLPAVCGNGVTEPSETCDDGNTSDNDACPADCVIDACTPAAGVTVVATVAFDAISPVGGMTLLVDYPEGQVHIPVTGPIPPSSFVPLIPPSEVLVRGFDFDHMMRVAVADGDPTEPVPLGALAQVTFQQCQGQPAPVSGDIACTVIEASDPFQNPIGGVTCSVSIP